MPDIADLINVIVLVVSLNILPLVFISYLSPDHLQMLKCP